MTPLSKPTTFIGTFCGVVSPVPSWPSVFLPQHCTPPAVVTAQVCHDPALICATPLFSPTTSTGAARAVVLPSPSCPSEFPSQHLTPPFCIKTQVWLTPR